MDLLRVILKLSIEGELTKELKDELQRWFAHCDILVVANLIKLSSHHYAYNTTSISCPVQKLQ